MKTARDLSLRDRVYFYNNDGRYICSRTVKEYGLMGNPKDVLYFHFGFDKNGKTINAHPKFTDTDSKVVSYPTVKTHDNEIIFFSKEAAIEFFKNK